MLTHKKEKSVTESEACMRAALACAENAAAQGDIPVGAVIVRDADGSILASGYNTKERLHDASGHAEINAIRAACTALGRWRLDGCTLYVTMEPCPMCAGAVASARIKRVVFGVKDPNAGAFGSVFNLQKIPGTPAISVESGVLEQTCREQLQRFFAQKRASNQTDGGDLICK